MSRRRKPGARPGSRPVRKSIPADGAYMSGASGSPPPVSSFDPMAEIGATGNPIFAGRVFDEFLPELVDDRGRRLYREAADTDPIVGAFLFGVDKLVRKAVWSVKPADGDKSLDLAEFAEGCLHDMSISWHETLSMILSMLVYGWSFEEIIYKRRLGQDPGVDPESDEDPQRELPKSKFSDGKTGWRKWAPRIQESRLRWQMDAEGGVRGMWQLPAPDYKLRYIPIERGLLFRTTVARGSPEGRSLLRNSVDSWLRKRNVERIEAVGIERDLAGFPIVWVPPQWLNSDKATPDMVAAAQSLSDFVTAVRRDELEGAVLPRGYDDKGHPTVEFELVSSPGQRQFDLNETIGRLDQRIAMPMLADFILLGHEQVGSYNLGASKIDLFQAAVESLLATIAEVVNMHAIPRLMKINGFPVDRSPRLVPGAIMSADLDELGTFIQRVAASGGNWFPNEDLRSHLARLAGLPDNPPDPMPAGMLPGAPAVGAVGPRPRIPAAPGMAGLRTSPGQPEVKSPPQGDVK